MLDAASDVLRDRDDATLASMADGNFDAFAELYRRHAMTVFRYVRKQVRNDVTAEDIAAQTFFRAWCSADTYRGDAPYEAWLLRIAQNTIASWYGKEALTLLVDVAPDRKDPELEPSDVILLEEQRSEVRRVVAELPAEQRRAVVLRYLLEIPIVEVARLMGRTEGAVKLLLHRARRRLRRSVDNPAENPR